MARRFAKVLEEEIEERFFYPSDLLLKQLSPSGLVKNSGYIPLSIYPALFTSRSGDSCILSLRLIRCVEKETKKMFCKLFKFKAAQFSRPYSRIWLAKLTNHSAHTNFLPSRSLYIRESDLKYQCHDISYFFKDRNYITNLHCRPDKI